jgi:serine/threonine-protein phosphatase PP1 catalytic subunit
MKSTEIDVDKIINKLLEASNFKVGKEINLNEGEIMGLAVKSREIFAAQPLMLDLDSPITICGKTFYPHSKTL